MVIVLTSEKNVSEEANVINSLFANGLQVLHLRKPEFSKERYRELLDQIEKPFHNRIMLHYFHDLCKEYKLRGVHIQEKPRIDLGAKLEKYVQSYIEKGYRVSSSFHLPETIEACPVSFDYVLLSPVFSSISKQGYEGRGFDVTQSSKKIIGMGGINKETIRATCDLGYKGVGILGGVWNTTDPLTSFIEIQQAYEAVTKK